MSLQLHNIKISVHTDCRWAGGERFHVRATVTSEQIADFLSSVIGWGFDEDSDYLDTSARFDFCGMRFRIEEGEYDRRCIDLDGLVYFAVGVGSVRADFTPHQGGWTIDFSIDKSFGDDRDLDTWDMSGKLPECFWLEPASIIRAILGKGAH
jgi:hypothetical protein